MKLLFDQGMPCTTASIFRNSGMDSLHVSGCGLATATDEEIVYYARKQGRIIFTLDADFHSILARTNAEMPFIARIRIEGLKANSLAVLVLNIIESCDKELSNGAVASVDENRIRVHNLPLH